MNVDKAGRAYWDRLWSAPGAELSPPSRSVRYLEKRFRRFFSEIFADMETSGARLLEAGCGDSTWLPYFAKEFGFVVSGIDYSTSGCERARANLSMQNTTGEIVCADFFDPPEGMRNVFDVVFSSGVVEHFTDAAACVRSLASFLKPGGLIITSVPNMTGICGFMQKLLNPSVFELHVPMDTTALAKAHEQAGLQGSACAYFMSTNFGIVSLQGIAQRSLAGSFKKTAVATLTRFSYLVWIIEDFVRPIKPNSLSSPYVNCVARRPNNDRN